MAIVDKETFSNLVKHPGLVDHEMIPQLKAIIKAFPYCQIPYALMAKASSLSGPEELEKTRPLAAAYALSRIALQNLVENNHERYDATANMEGPIAGRDRPVNLDREDILISLVAEEPLAMDIRRSEEQKKQQQIIEGFMKKNPRILRQESNLEPVTLDVHGRLAHAGTGSIETEAFAQILIRQGKTEKAIDLYQKLILKNPKKRNYFAKKLSELYHSGQ